MRTFDTGKRLPLVAICAAWRADQVLYGSCTIGVYNDDAVSGADLGGGGGGGGGIGGS